MSKTKIQYSALAESAPDPIEPPQGIACMVMPLDENLGKGGTYLRDPETGERVLISRTTGCCGE